MTIKSRVINTRTPITSRSGCARATKARETLETAREILRLSGRHAAADAITPVIAELSSAIAGYYESPEYQRYLGGLR